MKKFILAALICCSSTVFAAGAGDIYLDWREVQLKGHDYLYMQKKGTDNGTFLHDPDCKLCKEQNRIVLVNKTPNIKELQGSEPIKK